MLVTEDKTGSWFLSSADPYPYMHTTAVYAVSEKGSQVLYSIDTDYIGVRPSMWVKIL